MRNELLNEIELVVSELDGHYCAPNRYSNPFNKIRIFFFKNQEFVVDEIVFDIDFSKEYGVSLSSKLFKRKMSLKEYVYNLIQELEYKFSHNFKLKSTTAKHYFIWERTVLKKNHKDWKISSMQFI